ncbi:NAD(P)/FAD-dependent oxidoreductase [Trujillonella humicola]|uniref:NAD(P)/FAD-dependent oxidoreductase n=1 Tax=Trujillonella humicola TaxID=3383699 RepID=UPI00390634D9
MTARYDVVVVGARVAGAATALQLARRGARVLVLDRGRYGSDTVSTHALMRTGVVQLSRWGLLDRLVAAGVPPVRSTVFHHASGDSRISLRPAAGVDALYAPRRTTLDALLVDAAAEAGAEVRHGLRATGLLRDRSGRVAGVVAEGPHGRPVEVAAAVTVGADGVRSDVARWVGAPVERTARAASGVLYGYRADLPTDGYEWAYGGLASAGLIPTQDGLTCVFTGTSDARFRALPGGAADRFAELLAEASPDVAARVAGAAPVGRLHGFAGQPGFLRRAGGPGWALVGDAGYFKDPLSTHGMSDALRDAELLARALTAPGPEAAALAGYQRERDRLSVALFDVTERVAAHDWTEEELRRLLRELAAAMSDEIEVLLGLDDARPAA